MKLASYKYNGVASIGRVHEDRILDLVRAAAGVPTSMTEFLQGGPDMLARANAVRFDEKRTVPLADVQLLAPVPRPSKYLAIGLNYQDHMEEAIRKGLKVPTVQLWFNKQVSCVAGPYDPIHMPAVSDKLDYEIELGVVIGRRCRHVSAQNASRVIAGYLVTNDVSVRDWQSRSPTFTLGKSFDTHGPCGPFLVTADEIADPHALEMKLTVNGTLRQASSTSQMIYDIYAQIAHLSTVMTLEPGDILATGTPKGVGAAMEPPQFLKVGDVVRAQIDGLGYIENTVITEPPTLHSFGTRDAA
jgi:2-keto-4-pentenoate hydratase/2-oxohepta-3-ene-1,7-dioic acid hydratase in catechol pathway